MNDLKKSFICHKDTAKNIVFQIFARLAKGESTICSNGILLHYYSGILFDYYLHVSEAPFSLPSSYLLLTLYISSTFQSGCLGSCLSRQVGVIIRAEILQKSGIILNFSEKTMNISCFCEMF